MGEGICLRNANGSSQSWLLFSKRLIHSVDVFISLHQCIMMKLSFFLPDLHHTYEKGKGGKLREDGAQHMLDTWGLSQ